VTCLAGSTWHSVRGTHDDDVHAFAQMRDVACGDAKERVGGYRGFSSMAEERRLAGAVPYTARVAALLASIFAQF
jgi:hypothetical protein